MLFDWRQPGKDTDIVAVSDFADHLLASRFRLILSCRIREKRHGMKLQDVPIVRFRAGRAPTTLVDSRFSPALPSQRSYGVY